MFNVFETKVAAPLLPVVVKVIAFCFVLNVVQSVLLSKPFWAGVAVAMAIVILPLVVIGELAIDTPLVALVNPTEVTVPLGAAPYVNIPFVVL
jgi:hypothetical protein